MNATTTSTDSTTPSTAGRRFSRRPVAVLGVSAVALGLVAGASFGIAQATAASPGQLVVIDGKTNPDQAKDALKLWSGATNTHFTATSQPAYGHSDWAPATDVHGNPAGTITGNAKTGQPMTMIYDVNHESHSSWSLGGSLETSVGFDVLEVVDVELSAKVTADHTWEKSDSDGQRLTVTAIPGKTVWIEDTTSTATVTGTFSFDENGAHYEITNVSITQPASQPNGSRAAGTYRVMEKDAASVGMPQDTVGGVTPISALPKLQQYIAQGH